MCGSLTRERTPIFNRIRKIIYKIKSCAHSNLDQSGELHSDKSQGSSDPHWTSTYSVVGVHMCQCAHSNPGTDSVPVEHRQFGRPPLRSGYGAVADDQQGNTGWLCGSTG